MVTACRFCITPLENVFIDLGTSPIANEYIKDTNTPETFFPLCVYVCAQCLLVQLPEVASRERVFQNNYAYFSSYSTSWIRHVKNYTHSMIERFKLNEKSFVIEVASNDGYLLQFFKEKNIPHLGIDPADTVSNKANQNGVKTLVEFFGEKLAQSLAQEKKAQLMIANNVLAHVPDINDFLKGFKILLAKDGVATFEFPHLMNLINQTEFDTIYHEHYSYFSFTTVEKIFLHHGLTLFDVEELPTHGGSLRIFARHTEHTNLSITQNILNLKLKEQSQSLDTIFGYQNFKDKVEQIKRNTLKFLIEKKEQNKSIIGYGAPAKGNTFLNYCGIRTDFIDYTVDRNPYKANNFLPGTHIPIFSEKKN